MPFFTLNDGSRMFYRDEGSGSPPLVLVHGWASSNWIWNRQVPYFSKFYRVIAPDLKGHGASDKPQGSYTVRGFAEELNQLLDKVLGEEKFFLCGIWMGGFISLTYATDPVLSKKLKGIILSNTTYTLKGNPAVKGLMDALKKGLMGTRKSAAETLAKTAFNIKFQSEHKEIMQIFVEDILKCVDHVLIRCLESWVDEYDLTTELSKISVPVQIITSDTDGMMDPKYSSYMKEHIEDSQLVVLEPSIGHATVLEAPSKFNSVVKSFMDRVK